MARLQRRGWVMVGIVAATISAAAMSPLHAAEPLPRRAALGVQLANVPENDGVLVQAVLPGTTAQALGVQVGDRLLALNDAPVKTVTEVLAWLANSRSGATVALKLRRDGQEIVLRGTAGERMRDPGNAAYRVEYGEVAIDGARLRTLTSVPTTPAPGGRHPVLFYVQGVALGTVDTVLADGNPYSRFLQPFAQAGYITYRVEKPGVGDSEGGPGTAVDFERELDGYRAGLKALLARDDVDPRRVFVFGHSMGGVWGPILADEFRLRGLAVYGTAYRGWYDYELENARRQYALAGMQGAMLDAAMAQKTRISQLFLQQRRTPERIAAEHPELRPAMAEMFQGGVYLGRALPFWHQLNAIDMPAMWGRADTAVLAMHGAGDYVSSAEDHRAIAERVNALRPGTAKHVEVPNADHGMMGFASERAAYAGFGQPGAIYSETVAVALDDWLAPLSGLRAFPPQNASLRLLPDGAGQGRTMDVGQGDADGDGDLDLFLAKEFAPNVLLRNDDGRYRLVEGALPAAAEDSEDAVLADFDGDGDLDAVFPSEDTANNEYLLNDGKGAFAASPHPLPTATQSNAGVAGDIDGDGDVDLILSRNAARELVLRNDGRGRFEDVSATWMPDVIDVTQDLALVDIDGDRDLDLIAGNEPANGGRNRVYVNRGRAFVDETDARLPAPSAPEETRKIAMGDIDGDGDADLLFANVDFRMPAAARSRLLINDGGRFRDETAARLPERAQSTLDALFEDLDGDRDVDLLLGTIGAGSQRLQNDGRGRFSAVDDAFGEADPQRVGIAIALLRTPQGLRLYESGFDRGDRVLEAGG
ncbi:alpha/beta fold hydrolase [Lysobacter hankyongensis]|uniref:PDZ domain-containing protein n=1 Tax=Lysobacter hankyongensis TaxID=1176535 RepID=A0ABP9AL60_9GAMM